LCCESGCAGAGVPLKKMQLSKVWFSQNTKCLASNKWATKTNQASSSLGTVATAPSVSESDLGENAWPELPNSPALPTSIYCVKTQHTADW
jgi:hypothetical protein